MMTVPGEFVKEKWDFCVFSWKNKKDMVIKVCLWAGQTCYADKKPFAATPERYVTATVCCDGGRI